VRSRHARVDHPGGSVKGIIFNLAEEVVSDLHGEEAWDAVLDTAGVTGAYTSLGSYPDDDLHRIVAAGAQQLDASRSDVLRAVGAGAMPRLAARYPEFFAPHRTTRSFVLTLNDIIHPEVRKLYPGANVPQFEFDTSADDVLVVTYRSDRRLCALAEGFLLGAAPRFGEQALLTHIRCMHEGDDHCAISCRFAPA
jgi:hypothetical protein